MPPTRAGDAAVTEPNRQHVAACSFDALSDSHDQAFVGRVTGDWDGQAFRAAGRPTTSHEPSGWLVQSQVNSAGPNREGGADGGPVGHVVRVSARRASSRPTRVSSGPGRRDTLAA